MAIPVVGHLLSHGHWPALHLAGKLCHPYVGIATVFDRRYVQKQFLGGLADFWRGLAQQPSRTSAVAPSWLCLVRTRSQLVRNLYTADARSCSGPQVAEEDDPCLSFSTLQISLICRTSNPPQHTN